MMAKSVFVRYLYVIWVLNADWFLAALSSLAVLTTIKYVNRCCVVTGNCIHDTEKVLRLVFDGHF